MDFIFQLSSFEGHPCTQSFQVSNKLLDKSMTTFAVNCSEKQSAIWADIIM